MRCLLDAVIDFSRDIFARARAIHLSAAATFYAACLLSPFTLIRLFICCLCRHFLRLMPADVFCAFIFAA